MDSYDDTQRGHPSESIHNAAYPDAPYQPGQGQQPQYHHPHQLGLNTTSPSTTTYDHASSYPLSTPSSSRHTQSPMSPWTDDAATAAAPANPQDPPPPYVARQQQQPQSQPHPHRQATADYPPLAGPLLANQPPATSSNEVQMGPMIPLQPIHSHSSSSVPSYTAQNEYYAPPAPLAYSQSHMARQQRRQQEQPHLNIENGGLLVPTATTISKPNPLMDARLRKRRRLKICLIATTLLFVIFVALTVGVAWRVYDWGEDGDGNGSDDTQS